MQSVFVLDNQQQPLMPCHPARARQLLKARKAAVWRRQPFTIILKDRTSGDLQPTTLKIDPGSKTTGVAIVAETKQAPHVIWAAELTHRGQTIHEALQSRRAIRHSRRARHTRYRPARFNNRHRKPGWLPPSLNSRIDNITNWTVKLSRLCPITHISQELVKFDTQLLENPDISGIEYQQGTLAGYEIREYLLEKWNRTCVYCGVKEVPFEIDHVHPKSRHGSDRPSNLTLACHDCNQEKGDQTAAEFGHPEVQQQAKKPLPDAAAVNSTRWALYTRLQSFGLQVETGTGGRTKWNRVSQNYPKAHWIDAACIGPSGHQLRIDPDHQPLLIKAMGRGTRQMCRMNQFGFPRTSAKKNKRVYGFQTGDLVKATVPKGKHIGQHIGRIAIRTTGKFNLTINSGILQGVNHKHCQLLQHTDGYQYQKGKLAVPPQV